jgi:hypothetical protein
MQKHSRPIPDIGASPQCCIATSRKLPFAMNAIAGGGRIHTLRTKLSFVKRPKFVLRVRKIAPNGGMRKFTADAGSWCAGNESGHSNEVESAPFRGLCKGDRSLYSQGWFYERQLATLQNCSRKPMLFTYGTQSKVPAPFRSNYVSEELSRSVVN